MAVDDRRRFPRFSGGTMFAGQGPTGVVEGRSADQGPGGAFIETVQPVRPDSRIILTVHDPFGQDQPVFLVARVVTYRKEPKQGVGIEWHRAICRFGVERLKKFLDTHFHLIIDPQKTGMHAMSQLQGVISYDFKAGTVEPLPDKLLDELKEAETFYSFKFGGDFLPRAQYLEVRLMSPQDEVISRKMKSELSMDMAAFHKMDDYDSGAVVTQPITMESYSAECKLNESELEQWKYEMRKRKKSKLPVVLALGGRQLNAMVKNICKTDMFLVVDGVHPGKGDRTVVEMPVTVGNRSRSIIAVADITRIARDKNSGKVGLDLKIKSVDEQGEEGLFEEYLFAL